MTTAAASEQSEGLAGVGWEASAVDLAHATIDLVSRRAASGTDMDAPGRAELDEAGGHLAAARVVDAYEQYFGLLREDAGDLVLEPIGRFVDVALGYGIECLSHGQPPLVSTVIDAGP